MLNYTSNQLKLRHITKFLDVALSIVEGQEQNETLWPDNSSPGDKILQPELRWIHEIIKKVNLYQVDKI